MELVINAVLVVTGIGALAALLLIAASKFMHVPTDQRAEELTAVLPGANCGACGYAGCADYAAAVAEGRAEIGLCIPGGDKTAAGMAEIMGTEAVDIEEQVALVRCSGRLTHPPDKYNYVGVGSCAAASALFGGRASCRYGCLGLGDCQKACGFEAIQLLDGLAVVNQQRCTGCGACAAACPKGIIALVPLKRSAQVACMNTDRGAETRKICSAGCLGCGMCKRACEQEAITVENNLAHVDPSRCNNCGKCFGVCPTGCITLMIKNPPPPFEG